MRCKKEFCGQVCLGKAGLNKIKKIIYFRAFQSLKRLMAIVNLQEGDGRCGLSQTPIITKSFHQEAHREQRKDTLGNSVLGGQEELEVTTQTDGDREPEPVFSFCLPDARTQRLEQVLPLNVEVPIRALQSSSCRQLLSPLAQALAELNLGISGGTRLTGRAV